MNRQIRHTHSLHFLKTMRQQLRIQQRTQKGGKQSISTDAAKGLAGGDSPTTTGIEISLFSFSSFFSALTRGNEPTTTNQLRSLLGSSESVHSPLLARREEARSEAPSQSGLGRRASRLRGKGDS